MKRALIFLSLLAIAGSAVAENYLLSTPNTSLCLTAEVGKPLYFRYYGSRAEVDDIRAAGRMLKYDAYPAFGTLCDAPYAALVKQHDGDNATKFAVEKVEQTTLEELTRVSVWLRDIVHPNLAVKVNYSAFNDCDIIKINTVYFYEGK